jgi:hypothetical protein
MRQIDSSYDRQQTQHECGGTILLGGSGELVHLYCDRCGAFRSASDPGPFPTGVDREANQRAWDAGESRSPAGQIRVVVVTDGQYRWGAEREQLLAALQALGWERSLAPHSGGDCYIEPARESREDSPYNTLCEHVREAEGFGLYDEWDAGSPQIVGWLTYSEVDTASHPARRGVWTYVE